MSKTVNIHEAKMHLSKLLEQVGQGEEIIIAKSGKPVARLVGLNEKPKRRVPGSAKGTLSYTDDFNDPLPEEIQRYFE